MHTFISQVFTELTELQALCEAAGLQAHLEMTHLVEKVAPE